MGVKTKRQSGRTKALLARVVIIVSIMGLAAPALAASGGVTWNGGRAEWANSDNGTTAWAETEEDYNLARVRAQVYYRASSGSYYWSSNGWDNDSYDDISRTGEGIQSKHSLDTNLSGSYGVLHKSF